MKKYFYLQLKRVFKLLPALLISSILLCAGLGAFLFGMVENDKNDVKYEKLKIHIVGSADGGYLNMGVKALETLDSTRYAIEIEQTDEKTARAALEKGISSAYIVIPEGFAEAARHGDIMTIKYYTTDSAVGVVSIFKEEITKTISDILVTSEKGVYGMADALRENTSVENVGSYMNKLSFEYVSLILKRSEVYVIDTVGVSDGLSTAGYFLCGIMTLFILLLGLVAAGVFIKKDTSLCKVISTKGGGAFKQILSEYFAYFLLIFVFGAMILTVALIALTKVNFIPDVTWITLSDIPVILIKLVPAFLVITSLQFLLFEISSALVSGVLLQFGVAVSLGYVSGCFYPIYFFPESVQKLSEVLPAGLARTHFANMVCRDNQAQTLPYLIIYFLIFMLIAFLVRRFKIVGKG